MVVYLKVSIALKSGEHYDECLKAKKIELADEFKAKLGWLVGNMYSRVGTTDWEGVMSAKERQNMLNSDLHSRCIIGSKKQISELKIKLAESSESDFKYEDAATYIANIHIQNKYEEFMSIMEEIIDTSSKSIPQKEKQNLLNAIKSRSKLKTLIT